MRVPLSLSVPVCACITVDNVAVVVSPYTQSAESHAAFRMPFLRCACTHLASSCHALLRALFSHEIPLRFFRSVLSFSCSYARVFFARAFNFLNPPCARLSLYRVSARSRTLCFFRVLVKGSNLGTAWERVWVRVRVRDSVCLCVCVRVPSL